MDGREKGMRNLQQILRDRFNEIEMEEDIDSMHNLSQQSELSALTVEDSSSSEPSPGRAALVKPPVGTVATREQARAVSPVQSLASSYQTGGCEFTLEADF